MTRRPLITGTLEGISLVLVLASILGWGIVLQAMSHQ